MAVKASTPNRVRTVGYQDKHHKKPIRAIKITEGNYLKVANWSGGTAVETINKKQEPTDFRVKVKVPRQGFRVARVGDYIFKSVDGEFFVEKGETFLDRFELIKK